MKRQFHKLCMQWLLPLVASLVCACASAAPDTGAHGSKTFSQSQAGSSARQSDSASIPAEAPSDAPRGADTCPALALDLPDLITTDIDVPVPGIEDPTGVALDHLYERLARLIRKRAKDHVRIGMYGDSNMTRDFITGEMRRTLQLRHGDGGHGFLALGQPWNWYLHMDVKHGHDKSGWKPIAMSTHQVADRLYGFGGIGAQSQRPGAVTWVATAGEDSPVGKAISRLDVYFLKRPGAGSFTVKVDGQDRETVPTEAPEIGGGFFRFEVEDGPHRIDVVSGVKSSRVFGVAMERKTPGVVVDSLGIGGVNLALIAKGNRALAVETLRRRRYDLIMFLTGATEHASPGHVQALTELIAIQREANPQVGVLVMSPVDLAGGSGNQPTLNPRIPRLAAEKRKVALDNKAAYWDFRQAMGGQLSIVRFSERKMAWSDFIHLTEKGGRYMGRRFAYALERELQQWVKSHPQAGCSDDDAAK